MSRSFAGQVRELLSGQLPGEDAHRIMAPLHRVATREYLSGLKTDPRQSAVLILLFPGAFSIRTALIKRPDYQGVHSGQVSFPGGRFEDSDIILENTAIREAREETGIQPGQVTILGRLTQIYIPPSNFLVTPVIGYSDAEPAWQPDAREVEQIIVAGLSELFDEGNVGSGEFWSGYANSRIQAPCFRFEDYAIWGATAMIISEMKELLSPVIKNGSGGS